jgi:hypothetical protein
MIGWIIWIIIATALGFFIGLFLGVGAMIKHLIHDKKSLVFHGIVYRIHMEVSE